MEAGKTDTAEERYYTISEAARLLRVSDQSVRRWVKAGELRAYKPKKEYRIAESDLEEFLKERRVPLVQAPLLNFEEERREYPYPWMAGSLGRVAEDWRRIVEDPSKGRGYAKDPAYIRGVSVACFDIAASVVLIESDTGASGEEWGRLPEHEKRQRLEVSKHFQALARQALAHYKASEGSQEAEVLEIERRREEIRQRTAEISA
jgi:excisionase family DNA binding protein